MQHNRIRNPNQQRQPVGYLQAWPKIWTLDNQEQIQQVARVGLVPGTARLQVRRTDHLATLPPPSQENSNRNTGLLILAMFAFPKKVMEKTVNGSI